MCISDSVCSCFKFVPFFLVFYILPDCYNSTTGCYILVYGSAEHFNCKEDTKDLCEGELFKAYTASVKCIYYTSRIKSILQR